MGNGEAEGSTNRLREALARGQANTPRREAGGWARPGYAITLHIFQYPLLPLAEEADRKPGRFTFYHGGTRAQAGFFMNPMRIIRKGRFRA